MGRIELANPDWKRGDILIRIKNDNPAIITFTGNIGVFYRFNIAAGSQNFWINDDNGENNCYTDSFIKYDKPIVKLLR